ncbi:DEAD/DEAH box helicase [Tellurirhabdus rosea]|uniref:DEAD/DEAH box helicase n=1 Tax=Tellurirhabdus rosea TaxID=2674997 RepID=UPI0022515A9E|nr:DEAD/DEAH box helicase [Tellurirhabdus rosea]
MTFSSLGLADPLLKAVEEQQYTRPYPIQQQAIPAILRGRDIFGIAKTGTGKTAAYVLPILQMLLRHDLQRNRAVKALVLVPTRELAVQVAEVFDALSAHMPRRVKTVPVYGGVSINPQQIALRNAEIVVATPGRLIDLLENNALRISTIEMLVLDEADKMLDLGFAEEMAWIFNRVPQTRQTLLFSATLKDTIQEINDKMLHGAVKIEIEEEEANLEQIRQLAYRVSAEQKGPFLRYLIKKEDMKQVLVFVSSTRTADNVVGKLVKNGIQALAIHGQKTQGGRLEALRQFKSGKLTVLVATDLLARGIDIEELPYVINYELPRSPKDYIHRIGRTGRAEAVGTAISLITPDDEHHFRVIQKKMKKRVDLLETTDTDLQGY